MPVRAIRDTLVRRPRNWRPGSGFNGSQVFSDFVNQNAPAIIAEIPGAAGVVPSQFEGAPFMAGSVFNDLVEWSAPA